jgi:hypothetical protein
MAGAEAEEEDGTTQAQAQGQEQHRELAAGTYNYNITYLVSLVGEALGGAFASSSANAAAAASTAQAKIVSAVSRGNLTAAVRSVGGAAFSSAAATAVPQTILLSFVYTRTGPPTLAPAGLPQPTQAPSQTAANPTTDPLDVTQGNNLWILVSCGGFLVVFIFVFGLACHRYSLRRAEGKLRESSRLHKLEMKNLAEVKERKMKRLSKAKEISSSGSSSAKPGQGKGRGWGEGEEEALSAWSSAAAASPARDHEEKKEEKEKDEEREQARKKDARLDLLGKGSAKPSVLSRDDSRPRPHREGSANPPAAPAPASSAPAPSPWVEKYSKRHNKAYYKNANTGEVVWSLPKDALPLPGGDKGERGERGERSERHHRHQQQHEERERRVEEVRTSRRVGHEKVDNPVFSQDSHLPHSDPAPAGSDRDKDRSRSRDKDRDKGKERENEKHGLSRSSSSPSPSPSPYSSRHPGSAKPSSPSPDSRHNEKEREKEEWIEKQDAAKDCPYWKSAATGKITYTLPVGPNVVIMPYKVYAKLKRAASASASASPSPSPAPTPGSAKGSSRRL